MTSASLLCQLIDEYPSDWRERLRRVGVDCVEADYAPNLPATFPPRRPDEATRGLVVATYDPRMGGCDFSDPLVRECRGIVVDPVRREVACWPFSKFGNWFESYAAPIDWETAVVETKVDGQLVKLWNRGGRWVFSTMRIGDANMAPARLDVGWSTLDLIRSAENFRDIHMDGLDPSLTYMFELVSPYHRIVVEYPTTKLFHIGTRSNVTGEELLLDIGVERPEAVPAKGSLDDVMEAASRLNPGHMPEAEGFVVRDARFRRIKVKSEVYFELHYAFGNNVLSPKVAYPAIVEDDQELLHAWSTHPVLREQLETYRERYEAAVADVTRISEEMREAIRNGATRRDVVGSFRMSPEVGVAIRMAFSDMDVREAMSRLTRPALIRIAERSSAP